MRSREQEPGEVGKTRFVGVVLIAIGLLHAAALPAGARAFTTSDLEGTWDLHALSTGDSPQWTGWYHGTQSIDAAGNLTFTSWETSDGDSNLPDPNIMTISPTGVVTIAGMDLHGIMNTQRNMVVGVLSSGADSNDLFVSMKRGGSTFSDGDFAGTWNYVDLVSGDSPAQTPGWLWGSFTFDTSGDLTSASVVTDSLGNSDYTPSGISFDITSAGIVTESAGSVRGVMNSGKDMMVLVGTMCPASEPGIEGYNMIILIKDTGATFLTECMAGAWNFHALTSGDSPQWTGWAYGSQIADASGLLTFISATDSDGGHDVPPPMTASVSSSGILTIAGTDYHGLVNWRKDVAVGVMTDFYAGGYQMVVDLRAAGSVWKRDDGLPDFDGDGTTDLLWQRTSTSADFVTLMTGGVPGPYKYVGGGGDPDIWIRGLGDFDGDGTTDLLWRRTSTGTHFVTLVTGGVPGPYQYVGGGGDPDIGIIGLGYFDEDNTTDILWHRTSTGSNFVTLMTAGVPGAYQYVGGGGDPGLGIIGLGDCDGSGTTDILWHRTSTGAHFVTLMTAGVPGAYQYVGGGGDRDIGIIGLGDCDGNGTTDILWHRTTTGANFVTLMTAGVPGAYQYVGGGGDPDLGIFGLGDFAADGTTDLLWRRTSTDAHFVTLMTGGVPGPYLYVGGGGDPDLGIIGLGDCDGSGTTDILWQRTSSSANFVTLMTGGVPGAYLYVGGGGDPDLGIVDLE